MHNDKQEDASYTQGDTIRNTDQVEMERWVTQMLTRMPADMPERRMGQIQTDRRQTNPVTAATQLTSTQTW